MAGQYEPYPEYKDCGIDWIGQYPTTWNLTRVKFESYVKARVGWHGLKSDDFTDEGPYLVTGSDFRGPIINWEDCYHCDLIRYEQDPYIQLKEGDLLITKDGTIGKVALVSGLDGKATLNSGVFVVRPLSSNYSSRFYFWLLQSGAFTGFVDFNKTGSTIVHLYQETFVNFKYAMPSFEEQINIADFLDHETAKIDTLIERQKQLIQLLKEKRQAVISHAVTKGLNSFTKMRDSGIDWLGEVPEHWEVSKFGYISMVVRGGSPRPAGDPELFNGDYSPWVTVAEITKDDEIYLTQTETFLTKKGSEQCRVFSSGTLLISNSGATLGVPKILSIDANANDGVVGFENLQLDHEFSYFYLSTLTDDLRERIKQGSGQPNLNTEIVKNIAVPIPPKNEVSEIVAMIQNTRKQFANLMSRATAGIELLQERRTALISAAVTGKIDVRNWAPSKENHTNKEVAA
jgi:type I restriction enzyme S subunit